MKAWQKVGVTVLVVVPVMIVITMIFVVGVYWVRFRILSKVSSDCSRTYSGCGLTENEWWLEENVLSSKWFYLGVPVVVSGVGSMLVLKKTVWKK